MTLEQLQAKRDEILETIGLAGGTTSMGSVQYADQVKALAAIDREIEKLQTTPTATIGRFYTSEGL
jgi:precorrin-6B methylase 2